MFKDKVINSFKKIKKDISEIKNNFSDWIMFYNNKHSEHDRKIEMLEQRIIFLERQKLEGEWYNG